LASTKSNIEPTVVLRVGVWALRLAAGLSLVLSIYLTWLSVTHQPVVGCGSGPLVDCDHVLDSPWSRWLGIPVAMGGVGVYAGILILSGMLRLPPSAAPRWVWYALVLLVTIAATSAAWFVGLQLFVVAKICIYCIATHAGGFVAAAMVVWLSMSVGVGRTTDSQPASDLIRSSLGIPGHAETQQADAPAIGIKPVVGCVLAGTVVVLTLVGGQVVWPEQTHREFVAVELANVDESALPELSAPTASDTTVSQPTPSSTPADAANNAAAAVTLTPHGTSNVSDLPATEEASANTDDGPPIKNTPLRSTSSDSTTGPPKPAAPRLASFIQGQLTVDTGDYPLLGTPDAPNMILELIDYTCPTCRELHKTLVQARAEYGEQLTVVVLVVPLHPDCNPTLKNLDQSHADACRLARLSLAVWHIAPDAFQGFHDWLMDTTRSRSWEASQARAATLVDPQALDQRMRSQQIDSQLRDHTALFARVGAKSKLSLPILIVKDRVLVGAPSAPQLFDLWERELGVTRQPAAGSHGR
jgi:uncharacterized membrane protein/protein-disulfide isomerase